MIKIIDDCLSGVHTSCHHNGHRWFLLVLRGNMFSYFNNFAKFNNKHSKNVQNSTDTKSNTTEAQKSVFTIFHNLPSKLKFHIPGCLQELLHQIILQKKNENTAKELGQPMTSFY